MSFMRWFAGIILLFFMLGLVYKIGGLIINLLLIIGVSIFIFDVLFHGKKHV